MSNDISTPFTRLKNTERGRSGYIMYKQEKVTVISPKDYGEFIQNRRKRR